MSSPNALLRNGGSKQVLISSTKWRQEGVPMPRSRRWYQSYAEPVIWKVTYQILSFSMVCCPRKNCSQWFSHSNGSSWPSDVRKFSLWKRVTPPQLAARPSLVGRYAGGPSMSVTRGEGALAGAWGPPATWRGLGSRPSAARNPTSMMVSWSNLAVDYW